MPPLRTFQERQRQCSSAPSPWAAEEQPQLAGDLCRACGNETQVCSTPRTTTFYSTVSPPSSVHSARVPECQSDLRDLKYVMFNDLSQAGTDGLMAPPAPDVLQRARAESIAAADTGLWERADAHNPNPARFVPVQITGFSALHERRTQQLQAARDVGTKLRESQEVLRKLEDERIGAERIELDAQRGGGARELAQSSQHGTDATCIVSSEWKACACLSLTTTDRQAACQPRDI